MWIFQHLFHGSAFYSVKAKGAWAMLGFSDSVPGEKALRMWDFFKYLE